MRAVVLRSAMDLCVEDRDAPDASADGVRVRIEAGGICGSDLHYYQHGGFGAIRVREPLILGHEVAGRVIDAPADSGFAAGDIVAVSPSRPCGACQYCAQGLKNHCENMRFYGSAMPMPHVQGAFRDELVVLPEQCHRIDPDVGVERAAFAEPLAVVLHALRRAGDVSGQRVLITGCGPIGALTLLALRAAGAGEVVVTDVMDTALERAMALGADRVINVAEQPTWTGDFATGKGTFDAMFEASGVAAALADGMTTLRPRARLVQLGLGGDVAVPLNVLVAKEIDMRGSFRFHEEFAEAVDAINSGRIDVMPLLTDRFPVRDAVAAFTAAGDRQRSMKVQLDFTA